MLPLTDPDRFPDGPGAARAATRPCDDAVIPLAPQPLADPKIPALPAVRQLQVVVVPESALLGADVEPDTLFTEAGGTVGVFGVVPPQPESNNPSMMATLGPAATCNNLNFKVFSWGETEGQRRNKDIGLSAKTNRSCATVSRESSPDRPGNQNAVPSRT